MSKEQRRNAEADLTEEARRALRELPEDAPLPRGLEDRVVSALRGHGLIAPRPRAGHPLRFVAAAALFAAGLGTGMLVRTPAETKVLPGSLYLLLLYPGPAFSPGGPAEEAARVREYGAWAGALRRDGRLVSAERLRAGLRSFEGHAASTGAAGPQGFFLFRARDEAEAESIARACPHLRYGGRVAVQAVDPT